MIDLDYPNVVELFREHVDPQRSESASFLIWYLENYYRLDELEAVDSVCDKRGDKGVDGIFVNDDEQTITIFQSCISQRGDRRIGDAALRQFAGTMAQFETVEAIQNLIGAAGEARVAKLAARLELATKIATHGLRGEFVSNVELDANGEAFLRTSSNISFVGPSILHSTYVSDQRTQPVHKPITFDIGGFSVAEYIVDSDIKALFAPVSALQLTTMEGISDQALFIHNVRGPIGRTQVNRDIIKSLKDPTLHKMFPLFHNGVTVIARTLESTTDSIYVDDYFVVNGCQSLTSMFNNRAVLTDNLRVIVRFIKMDPDSDLAAKITSYSNNQNTMRSRDFKSNHSIQVRLQNEFVRHYRGQYVFLIKRGEQHDENVAAISNEEAGLYLLSFDSQQPWATHRKYEIFEDKYAELFGRPQVTADRIVLCKTIAEAIDERLPGIENRLLARYALTRYMLLYMVRKIIERDGLADRILGQPNEFVRQPTNRRRFRDCIATIVGDAIIDMNAEVSELGDDFDYRDKLRDEKWVESISRRILADYLKAVNRGRINSLQQEWEDGA